MKKFSVWLLFLGLMTERAAGQEVKLIGIATARSESALSLLRLSGCHPLWLSKALEDSKIEVGARHWLKPGQRLILETSLCEVLPPKEVALRSQLLMKSPASKHKLSKARSEGRAPVPPRVKEPQSLSTDVASSNTSGNPQQAKLPHLNLRNRELGLAGLGALLGSLATFLIMRRRRGYLSPSERMASSVDANLKGSSKP